jgi:hypothetical protein
MEQIAFSFSFDRPEATSHASPPGLTTAWGPTSVLIHNLACVSARGFVPPSASKVDPTKVGYLQVKSV